MGNMRTKNPVHWSTVVSYLLLIVASVKTDQSRRMCLQYSDDNSKNLSESYDLDNKSLIEIAMCVKWEKMCYILWKEDIKDGNVLFTVLRRGCWRYENNEKESCNTTSCLLTQYSHGDIHFCCCQGDLCNNDFSTKHVYPFAGQTNTSVQLTDIQYKQKKTNDLFLIGMILAGAFVSLLTCAITIIFCLRRKMMHKDTLPIIISHGSSLTELSQPKIISLLHVGKFSKVWYGTVQLKAVALKKFNASNYNSWKQETDIYKLVSDHPGILKVFGTCILDEIRGLSYIIVSEYLPTGSLRHFLQSNIVSWQTMCTMGRSLAEALAYLHGEEEKTRFSCIVHRDLTSENILVKTDYSCVLCDFKLAQVMTTQKQLSTAIHYYKQAGSPRYMAPEILEGQINLNDIATQLKQIDIYSVGTILWEISSRCADICHASKDPVCHLPFLDNITESTIENANVLPKGNLPLTFSDGWNTEKQQSVKDMKELIIQCWDEDPEARLSASCIRNRLIELQDN